MELHLRMYNNSNNNHKGDENMFTQKPAHKVYSSSFIHHCPNWKPPRCPSVGEWINKLANIQTVEQH